jgi:hypothetical protein
MKHAHLLGGATLALLALAGCGGGGTFQGAPIVREAFGRSVPTRAATTNFTVTVQTDKATYKVGDPIQITVSATNNTATERKLQYPTPFSYHRWGYIIAQNNKIVTYEYWDGHGERFPTVIGTDTYAPGETKTFAYAFPYPNTAGSKDGTETLAPGTYQVYARMPETVYTSDWQVTRYPDPTPASTPVTITVTK